MLADRSITWITKAEVNDCKFDTKLVSLLFAVPYSYYICCFIYYIFMFFYLISEVTCSNLIWHFCSQFLKNMNYVTDCMDI